MVDRIEKLRPTEHWKVQESAGTKKDKRGQSEEEKQKEQRSRFEEGTDWTRLISKDSGKREIQNLLTRDIQSLTFKGISTSRDQAALEADILLKDGTCKDSALITVPRAEGIKWIHYKPGTPVPLDAFAKDPYLRVSVGLLQTLSQGTKIAHEQTDGEKAETSERKESETSITKALSLSEIVLYSVGTILVLVVIYWLVRFLI
jgi:hypothetical protein